MIPRTDQFIEINENETAIVGVANAQDQVWHLLDALRDFLSVVSTLDRDRDGNYLAKDPRSGIQRSVSQSWSRVHSAAHLVQYTSLVLVTQRPDAHGALKNGLKIASGARPLTDVARSLIFLLEGSELEGTIPSAKIDRIQSIHDRIGELAMSDEIVRLRELQVDLQKWVQGTRGVRRWITTKVLPAVKGMVDKQEKFITARTNAVNRLEDERRRAWHEGRSLEVPDEVKAMYDRNSDPRHMCARRIGLLRDHGKRKEADIAEAYAVLAFHDAGEAGSIDKLMPLLADMRGLPARFDLGFFARCDSGLHRSSWEPRFSAEVMAGIIERFKARAPKTLDKPDGWTVKDLAAQIDVGLQTFRDMRDLAELPKPKRGQHDYRYGPDDVEKLATYLTSSTKPSWRPKAAKLQALLDPLVGV